MDILKPIYGEVWAASGEKLAPENTKIDSGWILEMMPYQYENFLQNRQDVAITYLMQKGVSEWSGEQEYTANKSVVQYQGHLYIATATVTNVVPTVTTSWRKLTVVVGANGTIPIGSGGTGATTAAQARANLGIGSAGGLDLPVANGLLIKLANNTLAARSVIGTEGLIEVVNGDGVAGNPTITVGNSVVRTNADASWTTTGSIRLPTGTTAQRGVAAAGRIRFNLDTATFEGYDGTAWTAVGTTGVFDVQNFSGNGVITSFTLSTTPRSENNTQVYINGIYQQKNTYELTDSVITFSVAPMEGVDNIEVVTATSVAIGTTTAGQTSITDSGNYYNSGNVEGALQEVGISLSNNANTLSKTVLSFPDLPSAITYATTLPDGQVVDVDSEKKRYYVQGGALVYLPGSAADRLAQSVISLAGVCARGNGAGVSAANKVTLEALLARCVIEGRALQIPGDWYIDGGVECMTGLVPLIGPGRIITNVKGPWLTMKAIGGAGHEVTNFYAENIVGVNLDGTGDQRESSFLKFQSDGAFISFPTLRNIFSFGFYQTIDDDAGVYYTGFGAGYESLMNHGLVDACVPSYFKFPGYASFLNGKYFIRRRTGSGTGWKYVNCRDNLAVGGPENGYTDPIGDEVHGWPAYVRLEDGGIGAVVSDTLWDGHVVGKNSGAISISGACTYNSNITTTQSSQLDAQAKHLIYYDPPAVNQPVIRVNNMPANVGGDLDISADMPTTVGSKAIAQGFGYAHGGDYISIPGGAFSKVVAEIQVQKFFGFELVLRVTGLLNGVAIGFRKKVFTVWHTGDDIQWTLEEDGSRDRPEGLLGENFYDFTLSKSGGLVSITMTANGQTGSEPNICSWQYEVFEGAWTVHRK